ncbi:MAG: HEAT repeat domain-containing protein, partial [Oceanobacter sp.]
MALVKRDITTADPSLNMPEQPEVLDCNQLKDNLFGSNPIKRRQAAQDIIKCDGASELLLTQLKQETSSSVRQVILTSLTHIGDQIAVQGLANCLRLEDAALRNEAIEAMKQLPDQVAQVVPELLRDEDPDVRIFTVNILESLCHQDVEDWLIEVLEQDDHLNVINTAIDLLGEVGTEAAVEAL